MTISRLIPIHFSLLNTVNQEATVFTMDQGEGQTMELRITNHTHGNLTIPQGTGSVSASNYHLALQLSPGLLADPTSVEFNPLPDAQAPWEVLAGEDVQGFHVFYLLWKGSPLVLPPDDAASHIAFRLEKFKVDPGLSWQHTTVVLRSQGLELADGLSLPPAQRRLPLTVLHTFSVDLSDLENAHTIDELRDELTIVRDTLAPPLQARIVGGVNWLRAQDQAEFTVEVSLNPDFFGIHDHDQVQFKTGKTSLVIHPLMSPTSGGGTVLNVENVQPANNWGSAQTSSNTGQVHILASKDNQLGPGQTIRFQVKDLKTPGLSMANLRITCQNLHHQDRVYENFSLHLPLYLGTLEVDPTHYHTILNRVKGNVGIGEENPSAAKLMVKGRGGTNIDFVVNGRMQSNNTNGGLWVSNDRFVGGTDSRIGFYAGKKWRLTVAANGLTELTGTSETETGNGILKIGAFGAPNLRLGVLNSGKQRSWIQSHGSLPLYINKVGNDVILNRDRGRVGVGMEPGSGIKLDVSGTVRASNFRIGSTTIDEKDLQLLRELRNGTLEFDLYNTKQKEYLYAADYAPYDNDRRRVFTWRRGSRVSQGRWRMVLPS